MKPALGLAWSKSRSGRCTTSGVSFSTRANELGLGPPWLIEACLNHVIGGDHDTYNRAIMSAATRGV
jgi:hypothetical protein